MVQTVEAILTVVMWSVCVECFVIPMTQTCYCQALHHTEDISPENDQQTTRCNKRNMPVNNVMH